MRNFITIKNEKERKIFLSYCEKHNTKLASGRKVKEEMEIFEKCDFQIFFGNCFDRLTYSLGVMFVQENGCYNEIKFNNFFKVNNMLEIE